MCIDTHPVSNANKRRKKNMENPHFSCPPNEIKKKQTVNCVTVTVV